MSDSITVTLPTDETGYLGRECPKCEKYFKVMLGTGILGPAPCHCPYCDHSGPADTFYTPEQIEFARSLAFRAVSDEFSRMLKGLEGPLGPQDGFINMSIKVTPGTPPPIKYYNERNLETEVTCEQCTLKYTIYGLFAYCPDCGEHNSLQILERNLSLIEKMLGVSESLDGELKAHVIADALENAVSAFDAFGREAVRTATQARPEGVRGCSFQNLDKSRELLRRELGFELAAGIAPELWLEAVRGFQKRHLLAHTMGVVDQGYIDATNDKTAIVGRKIAITADEVRGLVGILRQLGSALRASLGTLQRKMP